MYSVFVALYLTATFAVCEAIPEIQIPVPPYGYLHVTLLSYTGLRDPVWRISKYSNPGILNLLLHAKSFGYVYQHKCIPPRTGYKGFLVEESAAEELLIVGRETIQLQLLLLDTMPCDLPPTGYYRERIRKVVTSGSVSADCPEAAPVAIVQSGLWNANDTIRRKNNCYNYAVNEITNSYLQPGEKGGRIYADINPGELRKASVRDGWVVLNPHLTVNDTFRAADVFLTALFVAPGSCHEGGDFHWYRQDHNGTWSHKPGQTRATDLDDANRVISDPRTADTGVYEFVCFTTTPEDYIALNGTVVILKPTTAATTPTTGAPCITATTRTAATTAATATNGATATKAATGAKAGKSTSGTTRTIPTTATTVTTATTTSTATTTTTPTTPTTATTTTAPTTPTTATTTTTTQQKNAFLITGKDDSLFE